MNPTTFLIERLKTVCVDTQQGQERHDFDVKAINDAIAALQRLTGASEGGPCPNGCRATYNDCNANTTMRVVDEAGKEVSLEYGRG